MRSQFAALLKEIGGNLRDLFPIVVVVAVFQVLFVRQPVPDWERRVAGVAAVLVGMTLFVRGLTLSIFPLGTAMADGLARRGSLALLLAFGFALGFGSTAAEPALAAVADQAAGAIGPRTTDPARLSLLLRYSASFGVGVAVALGVLRTVKGWPAFWFVAPGYVAASLIALVSPSPVSAVAFDAGAAATSAINIPLMLALGVGLASMLRQRHPLVDGFGLVAMASLVPMLIILVLLWIVG